jgi:hypothetical protein
MKTMATLIGMLAIALGSAGSALASTQSGAHAKSPLAHHHRHHHRRHSHTGIGPGGDQDGDNSGAPSDGDGNF